MTASQKKQASIAILVVGAAGLWYWWRRRQGLPLVPNFGGAGGGGYAGSTNTTPGVGGNTRIDDPTISKLRAEQTGAMARTNCLPTPANRWINTTTGPFYGKCVPNDVFQQWAALPGDVQLYATDATYFEFMRSIGRA